MITLGITEVAIHVSLANVGGLVIGACQEALSTLENTSLRWSCESRRQCGCCPLCTLVNPEDAARESPNIVRAGSEFVGNAGAVVGVSVNIDGPGGGGMSVAIGWNG
jgi:hypothetical protein